MKTAPPPKQVWECPADGWRYESPIALTSICCPHDHRANAKPCQLIWQTADGGTPPPPSER